jgi:hypothetical protein
VQISGVEVDFTPLKQFEVEQKIGAGINSDPILECARLLQRSFCVCMCFIDSLEMHDSKKLGGADPGTDFLPPPQTGSNPNFHCHKRGRCTPDLEAPAFCDKSNIKASVEPEG